MNGEIFTHTVKVADTTGYAADAIMMAEAGNPYHAASPSNGDLWIMYVKPGDVVTAGEELFNITIIKQEKSVAAAVDGIVESVIKTADYKFDKKIAPVKNGELLVKLGPLPKKWAACGTPFANTDYKFCPQCGEKV